MSRRSLVRASVATFALGVLLGVPAASSAAPADKDKTVKEQTDKGGGSLMSVKTDPLGRKAG